MIENLSYIVVIPENASRFYYIAQIEFLYHSYTCFQLIECISYIHIEKEIFSVDIKLVTTNAKFLKIL